LSDTGLRETHDIILPVLIHRSEGSSSVSVQHFLGIRQSSFLKILIFLSIGERMKELFCVVPAAAQVGISVTAVTYADDVYISVVAEGALEAAAQILVTNLEHQVRY